jgi:lantibiotic modifying enzyme
MTLRTLAGVPYQQSHILNDEETDRLKVFIHSACKKPWVIFDEHAVLARLLSSACMDWVEGTRELLRRFVRDYKDITRLLLGEAGGHSDAGEIIREIESIESDMSDPHEGGRTVMILALRGGRKVVYKPKSMTPEAAFGDFVAWLNRLGLSLDLHAMTVLDRGSYGWSEFVQHIPCVSRDEQARFYRRIGMFSAVFYLLRGIDYHRDNLVAHGEQPVFIDHEMLFYPSYIDPGRTELREHTLGKVQSDYYESVINSRLFPVHERRVNGEVADVSAVGYRDESGVNPHLPLCEGQYPEPGQYIGEILAGFREAYELFVSRRAELLSEEGPMKPFTDSSYRFNIRATSAYLSIRNLCLVPDALKTGHGFCVYIHGVRSRLPAIFSGELPQGLRLEELKMLSRLDVPRFMSRPESKKIYAPGVGALDEVLTYTGKELVTARIHALGEEDMERQAGFIAASLSAR